MFEDFFNSLNELSKTNKIILAIDEFQQIANINDVKLDAMMRKIYPRKKQNISLYIFRFKTTSFNFTFLNIKHHFMN